MFRFLNNSDLPSLHRCYLEAFSDYAVNMQITEKQFVERQTHTGADYERSVGAFDGERMIGFTINGFGLWQGKVTAYDCATGIIPEYRRRGISRKLFEWMLPQLKEFEVSQYLLEVISTNTPAVDLYKSLGFEQTRGLAVFRADSLLKEYKSSLDIEIRQIETPDWQLFRSFWDGLPTWQYSIESFDRIIAEKAIFGAFLYEICIGYVILLPASGTIFQLAVAQDHRRKSIGSQLLAACEKVTSDGQFLKINNVDYSLTGAIDFFKARGFNVLLNQYEMIKTL